MLLASKKFNFKFGYLKETSLLAVHFLMYKTL